MIKNGNSEAMDDFCTFLNHGFLQFDDSRNLALDLFSVIVDSTLALLFNVLLKSIYRPRVHSYRPRKLDNLIAMQTFAHDNEHFINKVFLDDDDGTNKDLTIFRVNFCHCV